MQWQVHKAAGSIMGGEISNEDILSHPFSHLSRELEKGLAYSVSMAEDSGLFTDQGWGRGILQMRMQAMFGTYLY